MSETEGQDHLGGKALSGSYQSLSFRGFPDIGYTASDAAAGTNSFGFAQVDSFTTADLDGSRQLVVSR